MPLYQHRFAGACAAGDIYIFSWWADRSKVTVPVLGLGIKPLGPKTLPNFPNNGIISGVAIIVSKSNQFSFSIFSNKSTSPT